MSTLALTRTPATSFVDSEIPDTKPRGSMTVSGRELEVSELEDEMVEWVDDCIECIERIEDCFNDIANYINSTFEAVDEAISTFFFDRAVDWQLFQRAFVSMGNGATSADIQRSIEVLTQLRTQLQGTEYLQAFRSFDDLRVEALIFDPIDFNYDSVQYIYADQIHQKLKSEFIRECDMAIFFQRTLSVVNIFYNIFGLNTSAPSHA